ncbi:hypothetical protein [Kribbella sp. NPDC050459]|uniref:hypothetical protein n=1 Tax=Kribbella sp. NPDC050459 TaxID=3155785 RepID=UPI00340EC65A
MDALQVQPVAVRAGHARWSAIAVPRHVVGRHHRDAALEPQSIQDALQRGDGMAAREAATVHIDRTLEGMRSGILRRVAG